MFDKVYLDANHIKKKIKLNRGEQFLSFLGTKPVFGFLVA